MSDSFDQLDRVFDLAGAICDDRATQEQCAELDRIAAEDANARDSYCGYCWLHITLGMEGRIERAVLQARRRDEFDVNALAPWESDALAASDSVPMPPVSVPPAWIASNYRETPGYFSSGWPVAYLIATVVFAIGALIGSMIYVSPTVQVANSRTSSGLSSAELQKKCVARITGTVDCRWERKGGVVSGEWRVAREGRGKVQGSRLKVQNRKIAKFPNSNPQSLIPNPSLATNHYPLTTRHKSLVCLGDQLILSAGLMEITYNSGAKVILQGPCTFEVNSADGGFLIIGKLTARVEQSSTKYGVRSTEQVASGEWLVASDKMQNEKCKLQNAKLANAKSPNPQIPKSLNPSLTTNHYPLFTIKTPTATITDLGTEFGVEVDRSGNTTSHVFRGAVQVQAVADDGAMRTEARVLRENESARVERRDGAASSISLRTFAASQHNDFIRELPCRAPIPVFSTGVGVRPGGNDLHWEIVAASNDPNYRPHPAVVVAPDIASWMVNDMERSQWISVNASTAAPNGVVFTFRTTFEVSDVPPESVELLCRFIADNHVRAIRLNGREIVVPEHPYGTWYDRFHHVKIAGGFRSGDNVLEIDVENGSPGCAESDSPMGLHVELQATGLRPAGSRESDDHTRSDNPKQ